MNKIVVLFCAVLIAFSTVPVFAAGQTERKCDGLFCGKKCLNFRYSLPDRISKLKTEIAKGESVYAVDELKLLEHKLKEDNATLSILQKPGK